MSDNIDRIMAVIDEGLLDHPTQDTTEWSAVVDAPMSPEEAVERLHELSGVISEAWDVIKPRLADVFDRIGSAMNAVVDEEADRKRRDADRSRAAFRRGARWYD